MNIKSFFAGIILAFILPATLFSQDISPVKSNQNLRYYSDSRIPAYLQPAEMIEKSNAIDWISNNYKITPGLGFRFISTDSDQLGWVHDKYQQIYQGIPLEFAVYQVHTKENRVVSFSGVAFDRIDIQNKLVLDEKEALNIALSYIDADSYMWEFPDEEAFLKAITEDINASYFPHAELVLINGKGNFKSGQLRYAYKFNIYTKEPLSRAEYYVDAENGNIIFINPLIHTTDEPGTAVTKYSGNQTITADKITADSFRLRESGRGKGIETYNMKKGTNYSAAVDFFDKDNYWNNVNADKDEIATDAHWGTEMTYDYYKIKHGRNSIDNKGYKLRSYVHYSVNYTNAFWNDQFMTYGDGNSSTQPFVAIDIIGHEITHGLTSNTADLVYASESGALNEGFSDIFGNMIELYAKPSEASWEMGEDIGYVIRDMSNPNSGGNPDTYEGLYWLNTKGCVPSQQNDQCGVHQNSTVNSYWFYLLANGGSGTNDKNNSFNVSGLGTDKAAAIAFRSLTVYLPPSADYEDARYYSARAAADLYGECSNEVTQVLKAWYAVGIGGDGISANFYASKTSSCAVPFNVEFTNTSDPHQQYIWDFGDGDTSHQLNPVHTYTNIGSYTVTLIAVSNCKTDTVIKTAYIIADDKLPCIYQMSSNSKRETASVCRGTLLDDGGSGNYNGNLESYFTIYVPGSSNIVLEFLSFEFEECPTGCDFLYIYDGKDETAPLIGKYTGSSLPNGGIITSSGNAITIRQSTDPYLTYSGFELKWYCSDSTQPPRADFKYKVISSCTGMVEFTSLGFNQPNQWFWDFGDGETSTLQHPQHEYKKTGIYSVKHKCINHVGEDSIVKQDLIVITRPDAPEIFEATSCGPASLQLRAYSNGIQRWYLNETDTSPFFTGDTLTTPYLNSSKIYYVMADYPSEPIHVGPVDNTFGNGGFFTGYQALIFNVYEDITLKSVKVYANGEKIRTIQLRDKNNTVLQEAVINIPGGESRIDLNFKIPKGNDYRLGTTTGADMYRNSTNAAYPYKIDNLIAITGSTASQAGYYYFFYDWEIMKQPCYSARVPAGAWIDSLKPKAGFAANQIHGLTIQFTNQSQNGRSFEWNFGDGSFSKEKQPVHIFPAAGNYNVSLLASNGCGDDSISKNVMAESSIQPANESGFIVYPNPVDNILFVSFGKIRPDRIIIYNSLGQNIQSIVNIPHNQKQTEINVTNWPDGLYFIQLSENDLISTKSFIIKK
ncbi:MAG TPA: M4 family metallopeptidase [Bacteroidia bacterium]|nr:M4 family metallopeptidase [Bacteroidia bacterium]HRS59971.1 M4 family metallopeptidase [Bacteroidia bacterium]HRU69005.1 M4 family metallopeptidase [Bacteroidia bacterium]